MLDLDLTTSPSTVIHLFVLSLDDFFTGFPRQPGQEIQVQFKYPCSATKLDQDIFFLSKVTHISRYLRTIFWTNYQTAIFWPTAKILGPKNQIAESPELIPENRF